MNIRTRDGRRFNRGERKPTGPENSSTSEGGADSKAGSRADVEQRLCDVEKPVNMLFRSSGPNKRRWVPSTARERAAKWRRPSEVQGTKGEPEESELKEEGGTGPEGRSADRDEAAPAAAPSDSESRLKGDDAWPRYETMESWLDKGPDDSAGRSFDLPTLKVSQHSLLEARAAATGRRQDVQEDTLTKAKNAVEIGRSWDKELQEQAPANKRAMIWLIEPALRAKDAEGTKKQKISCMSYWTTFCAAYWLDGETYGGALPVDEDKRTLKVQDEMVILAGFGGYVVMYPRQKGKTHNSVAHAERAVSVVKAFTTREGADARRGPELRLTSIHKSKRQLKDWQKCTRRTS